MSTKSTMYFTAVLYSINPVESWRSPSKTHPSRERPSDPVQSGALVIDSGVIGERSEWGMDTIAAVMYDTVSCCHLAVERLHHSYCVRLQPDNVEKGLLYVPSVALCDVQFLLRFSIAISFHLGSFILATQRTNFIFHFVIHSLRSIRFIHYLM